MMAVSTRFAPDLDLPARFMALAMASFAGSALTTPWTLPLLQGHFGDFHLLAFVHLNTLGFIGAMIFGASYQLVPVVLQTPLAAMQAARWSFWCYLGGLASFLAGLGWTWLPGLALGGSLLGVAFAIYTVVIVATWRRAARHEVIGWHIVAGIASADAGMLMGVLLAFNKSNGMLGGRLLDILPAHIMLMLAGWVALTFMGVAYRLVCMFTLAEKHFRPRLAWLALALQGGGVWLLAARFMPGLPPAYGQAAAVMMLAATIAFAWQLQGLYRRRMRRVVDIHMPFAIGALVAWMTAAALLLAGLARHESPNDPIWVAAGWLAIFGVAGTAIQGFFYKISTFLVWLKRYAPIAGRQRTPKLEELYNRRLALSGFGMWALAMAGGTGAILLERGALGVVAVLMVGAAACFLINIGGIARHWWQGERLSLREPVVPRQPHLVKR